MGEKGEFAMTSNVYMGDWIYTKGRRKLGMRKDNFSLDMWSLLSLKNVAFLRQWQDRGINVKTLEKLQKTGTNNWDLLEYRY